MTVLTEENRLKVAADISVQVLNAANGDSVVVSITRPGGPLPFPFHSAAGHTRASELLANGYWSTREPDNPAYAKPKSSQIEELLWEVGRSQALRIRELLDANDAIPDTLAPTKDTTQGGKAPLKDRIDVVLTRLATTENALAGVKGARCFECDGEMILICIDCNRTEKVK